MMNNKTNSTVLQLNSTLGNNLFNELILNYTTIRDIRAIGDKLFPQVNVAVAGGYRLTAGTEQYSGANGLNQDIIEITDNLTWYKGKHTFTFGTHNEFFKFGNLYIRNYYGYWEFASLDNFEKGISSRYYHDFITADPKQKWWAEFGVMQLGGYAGDNWAVLPNLNLTLGVRLDVPIINDIPAANPMVEAASRRQDQPGGLRQPALLAPHRLQLGRRQGQEDPGPRRHRHLLRPHPLRLDLQPVLQHRHGIHPPRYQKPDVRLRGRPHATSPRAGCTGGISEVDIIDKDFTYPAGAAHQPGRRPGTALGHHRHPGVHLFQEHQRNPLPEHEPEKHRRSSALGGRIMYARDVSKSFTDVIYLTNTSQGYQYSVSAQFQKNFNKNSWVNVTYSYGQAKDVNSGTSSQAASNFGYNPIRYDANNPELTWSNYDVRHRIGAAVSYSFNFIKNAPTTIGLFYGGRSGRPYSTTYNYNDANGDAATGNDLVYVPGRIDEIIMVDSSGATLGRPGHGLEPA